nr:RNA-directed DNA polymerase, eukaryota, reverse transcriptase zinc-binding domain protein [Tanacetum cinerariifolium]
MYYEPCLAADEVRLSIFMDTAYGGRWIRRIGNFEYAFSCEDLALIRHISFPGPTFEFSPKRGLRHGDPLSHFLFILIMEGLHVALSNAVTPGLIRGVKFGFLEMNLSHLFYAVDVVITTKWSTDDMDNIIRVFQVFYLALGCALGSFLFTYLGLPISSNMSLTSN